MTEHLVVTADEPDEHPLGVVMSSAGRPVLPSLPRGGDRGHELVCGSCSAVLARDRAPMAPPAPLLRCPSCQSVNDTARPRTAA